MTSVHSKSAELRLAAHDVSMTQLTSVMQRIGCKLEPPDFVESVSLAFQEIQSRHSMKGAEAAFRAEPSFSLFETALRLSSETGPNRSILVMGCAQGFAGKSSEFAMPTVAEVCQPAASRRIDSLDLSPDLLRSFPAGPFAGRKHGYDLLVSHSLLHFIPDVSQFFRLVRFMLKPSGGLILSHEPNARFWRNEACIAAVAELRREHRQGWRRILRSASILLKFRRDAKRPRISFWDEVNQVLEQRHGFTGRLAENEIRRLVDVHRPEAVPGNFRIGFDGFDTEEIARTYLPRFRLSWMATCGHLGYHPRQALSMHWRRRETALAEQYPYDGNVVTAYLRQGIVS